MPPKKEWGPTVRYLVAGGTAFGVDFAILAFLKEWVGLPVSLSAAIAFLVSFAYTYTVQRRFTFRSTAPQARSLLRYTLLVLFNTGATALIVWAFSLTWVGWVGGKVIAVIATTVWNFFAYKTWVFGSARPADNRSDSKEE